MVSGEGPDIFAKIYKRELTSADLAELAPNRFIEWKIGYRWDTLGVCRKFSEIRLIPMSPFMVEVLTETEQKERMCQS